MKNNIILKKFSFYDFKSLSRDYLNVDTFDQGFTLIKTERNVLISAPHGVTQTQLGKHKVAEIGSARTAIYLAKETNSNLIIKTKNLFDNANFDEDCPYRKAIAKLIKASNIKFLFDIHGLAKTRDCDINLGINYGENIKPNKPLFDKIVQTLENAGFKISIDQPFSGSYKTISGTFAREFGLFTVQIEINCGITNYETNFARLKKLLNALAECINLCKFS